MSGIKNSYSSEFDKNNNELDPKMFLLGVLVEITTRKRLFDPFGSTVSRI